MSTYIDNVTAIIVNYNTLHLARTALQSFTTVYPRMAVLLIDNGSTDGSAEWAYQVGADERNYVSALLLNDNIRHGPAMHRGFKAVDTKYVFTLDSDTITMKYGFIEGMLYRFARNPRLYAIGWLRLVNGNGVSAMPPCDASKYTRYIHPYAAMWDRQRYFHLPPFEDIGAPCNKNMHHITDTDWVVEDYPIKNYVEHLIAGTRRMWGGDWQAKGEPSEWNDKNHYPI